MNLSLDKRPRLFYFLLVLFTVLLVPTTFYLIPASGLDESWFIALNLAHKNQWVFGSDVVFTYGPLGILRYPLPIAASKWLFLCSGIFFVFTAAFGFWVFLKKYFRPAPLLFLFLCILISQYMEMEQWYYFFFLLFLFAFLGEPGRKGYLVQAGILSIIGLYFKINTGIVEAFLFFIVLFYLLLTRKVSRKVFAASFFGYGLLLLISAKLLHVDLIGYFRGSLHFIKDYGAVMYLPLDGSIGQAAAWCAGIMAVLLLGLVFLLLRNLVLQWEFRTSMDTLFIYGIIGLSIFIFYKSGFVRADRHVVHLFDMLGLLALLLYVQAPRGYSYPAMKVLCWGLLAIPLTFYSIVLEPEYRPYQRLARLSFVTDLKKNQTGYWQGFREYDGKKAEYDSMMTRLASPAAGNKYRQVIGDHTVDAVPLDIAGVYFNGLRYEARPTLQSYAAYNEYLDNLDYDKYTSRSAPDYVLYRNGSIDMRYAWSEESRVILALLTDYRLDTVLDDQLVLKKRTFRRKFAVSPPDTLRGRMGEDIPVKKINGLQFARIFVNYNLKGKLRNLFYQPPGLRMVITLNNDEVRTVRALVPVLADGFFINKYIADTREFQLLLDADGRMNADVRSIRLEPDSTGGFLPGITIVSQRYDFDTKEEHERIRDSVDLARLVDGGRPLRVLDPVRMSVDEKDLRIGVEDYQQNGGLLRLTGWAFDPAAEHLEQHITAVVRSESGRVYVAPTEKVDRHDVSISWLEKARFASMFLLAQLPPDTYEWGIAVTDSLHPKGLARYLSRYFLVKSAYKPVRLAGRVTIPPDTSIRYNVERITHVKGTVVVEGWVADPRAEAPKITHFILQGDKGSFRVNTDPLRRPDLAEAFHNPFLKKAGFHVEITKASLPDGIYEVGLELTDSNGAGRSFVSAQKKLVINNLDSTAPWRTANLPAVGELNGNLDGVNDDGELVSISGWVVNRPVPAKQDRIRIVLKSDTAAFVIGTERVFRPDIVQRFNNPAVDSCGFSVKVAKENLPPGKYRLGVLIYQDGGDAGKLMFFDRWVNKQ
jgi:hypothetical protein